MPDSNFTSDLEKFITASYADIFSAVSHACHNYQHGVTKAELEDLTQELYLLLREDDCHKAKTFNPQKAKFTTWIQTVANHHVSHHFYQKHCTEKLIEPLEDILLNTLPATSNQEKELWSKEQHDLLDEAIHTLSPHDQTIARLKLREAPNEEIAKELHIKPASVDREWRVIKTKLTQIVSARVQGKTRL